MSVAPRSTAEPNLDEMLKILDAASALRRERELVTEQLSVDEFRARLRDRMLAAAAASGNPVKPEEVEAAIDAYFHRLHAFAEPPTSFETVLAHAYVRRRAILGWGAVALTALTLGWWVFLRPESPLGLVGRSERALAAASRDVQGQIAAARALSIDPAANSRIEALATQAATFEGQGDTDKLKRLAPELSEIVAQLQTDYTIEVVHDPEKKSAVDRMRNDRDGKRVAGYYLIVEARDRDGKPVELRIRNEETDKDTKTTATWAERVPKEIYERLRADKQSDGRLDEFIYAVKRRGMLEPDIKMLGPDQRPLTRLGQITAW